MITPDDDELLSDDRDLDDAVDQRSQQDIHSNGFDEDEEPGTGNDDSDIDRLEQAYESSESAYTLDDGDEDEE